MLAKNTQVIIDCEWSSFHGLRGQVFGEDIRRRPLPSILVYVPGADADEDHKAAYFTRDELRVIEEASSSDGERTT
jgi:hypothetical protein